jgi:MraZ protein
MRFLFGKYAHTLDSKGRVAIPLRFRETLINDDSRRVTLLQGFEGCIFCYGADELEKILARLSTQAFDRKEIRELLRWLSSAGSVVDIDAQGRIQLNEEQRAVAGLQKEVLLIGAGSRIEIWSPERFESRPNKSDGAALAEGVLHNLPPGQDVHGE